ncbi:MAG: hypothetical protein ACR2L9_06190 [Solirubrobacteraceae bacterium]
MDANEFANISPVASEYLSLEPLQTRIDTHRRYSEREDDVEQAVVNLPDNATQVCDLVCRVVRSHGLEPPELPNERVNTETLPPAIARIFGHVAAHCDNALIFPTPEAERWFATHDAPWRDRKGYGVFIALRT